MGIFDDFEKELDDRVSVISGVDSVLIRQEEREFRWLAKRIGKITSSHLPDLKKGKKAAADYLLEVRHQLDTGEDSNFVTSASMRWGKEHEEEALFYYNKVMGTDMISGTYGFPDIVFIDNVIEGFGDSPDAIGHGGCVEIKCPYSGAEHLRNCALSEYGKSDQYYWQIMGHLLNDEYSYCDFVSFDPRYPDGHANKVKIIRIEKKDVQPDLYELKNDINNWISMVLNNKII